jgi:predicted metal-dependent phosphoesterase TrpH
MTDLHMHTTASDGRCTPRELLDRVVTAGITVMAVTDHDTTASVDEVQALAARRGVDAHAGIEITAVDDGRDIHVLGYFLNPAEPRLVEFLRQQRERRLTRVHTIALRLAGLGVPVDLQGLLDEAQRDPGRSIGRPQLARALQRAGHVADTKEAFDRFLGRGGPAFVSRQGSSPEVVIGIIHHAGGVASLAHPGRTRIDARIAALAAAGLDALEVYHSDHDAAAIERYHGVARALGLLMTGGSDFHGEPGHGIEPGASTLPPEDWQRLSAARHRHAAG